MGQQAHISSAPGPYLRKACQTIGGLKPYKPMGQRAQERWFDFFFGIKAKRRLERMIIGLSIAGFLVHLALIAAMELGWLALPGTEEHLFTSPISALYTPFSFILLYEVYLLVEQLPRSFTSSVQKQFEIIALILIRRIFKDISHLPLSGEWMQSAENRSLLLDLGIFLALFFLIYLFKRLRGRPVEQDQDGRFAQFIRIKAWISIALIPLLIGLMAFEFGSWLYELRQFQAGQIMALQDVNKVFYHDLFVVLILVDVFILLLSLNYIQSYNQLIRNSGYIVSTVLIRLSFTAEGIFNSLLILLGVVFGVGLLFIYNLVQAQEEPEE